MQVRKKEKRTWNLAGEFVVGEIDGDELGELRNEWGESSDVTGGIKGELSDSVAGAGYSTKKMSYTWRRTRVGGEVP